MDIKSAINIKKLNYSIASKQILKNINLEIEASKFTCIAGPNGCGKSTLLKHLINQIKAPDSTVFIDGKDINNLSQIEVARQISFLSQNSSIGQDFTVYECVELGRYCHFDTKNSKKIVEESLFQTGLWDIKDKYITQISGGEVQLAMLARALCQNSPVLILDEPTNNLDPKHRLLIFKIIQKQLEIGNTVIAVLHDLTSILNYADTTVLMKDGQIIDKGKTIDVVSEMNIKKIFEVDCQINLCRGQFPSAFCYSL